MAGLPSSAQTLGMTKRWFLTGCVLAFLGVALEAFGSHALRESLDPQRWATFQTGARNHIYHALALFGVSFALTQWEDTLVHIAGWLFVLGILLFSGSLYLLAITGFEFFGAVTGFGGLTWLVGWTALILGVLRNRKTREVA